MPTITATELARHTRQILDQVAQRRETVVVERNQTVIARLVPADPVMNAVQALEGLQQSLTIALKFCGSCAADALFHLGSGRNAFRPFGGTVQSEPFVESGRKRRLDPGIDRAPVKAVKQRVGHVTDCLCHGHVAPLRRCVWGERGDTGFQSLEVGCVGEGGGHGQQFIESGR